MGGGGNNRVWNSLLLGSGSLMEQTQAECRALVGGAGEPGPGAAREGQG